MVPILHFLRKALGVLCVGISCGSSVQAAPLHIIIDPGHGGHDRGAVRGPLKEAEIALKISLALAELLEKNPDFKVSLTRNSDSAVSLKERTQLAADIKADLFLSIHCNASEHPRAAGPEIFFQNQMPPDEEAMFLANRENEEAASEAVGSSEKAPKVSASDLTNIVEDLKRNYKISASFELSKILLSHIQKEGIKRNTRAIRQAPFQVVSNVNIPSILLEAGFITHRNEGPRLADENFQKEMAQNIYSALVKYKDLHNHASKLQ